MKRTWSDNELKLLKENYPIMDAAQLRQLLPMKTDTAIKSKALCLNLHKEKKRFEFTPKAVKILIDLYPNTLSSDIAKLIGCSLYSLYNKAASLNLKKDSSFIVEQGKLSIKKAGEASISARFKPGNIPANKGKEMKADVYDRCKHTMFKKGHRPANHKPVGHERITRDGYIEVKTAEPNVFELKHRLVYKECFGDIPEGFVIRFKNGNKLDVYPDNLYLMSKAENMSENTIHRYPDNVKKAIKTLSKLNKKINEYEAH